MSDHTFICDAREDSDFALKVTEDLKGRGIPVWLDKWNIAPGTDWDRAIEESLRTCANVVIVLSPAAVASNEVRGELRTALNGEKFIVPLLYQPCDTPRQIQHLQYIDFTVADVAKTRRLVTSRRCCCGGGHPSRTTPKASGPRRTAISGPRLLGRAGAAEPARRPGRRQGRSGGPAGANTEQRCHPRHPGRDATAPGRAAVG